MITVNINTIGQICKINLTNEIASIDLERHLDLQKNARWINLLIFSTLLKGVFILVEKRCFYGLNKKII